MSRKAMAAGGSEAGGAGAGGKASGALPQGQKISVNAGNVKGSKGGAGANKPQGGGCCK